MVERQKYNDQALAYIPRTLSEWYEQAAPGEVHALTRHEGVLACIDASGFTTLTGKLGAYGRQGPELLTNLLNRFFETMCHVAETFEGDVLKYAGDALWIFFPSAFDPQAFWDLTLNSWARAAQNDPLVGLHPITIHAGAEKGEFYLASLGDKESLMEAEPVGELVSRVFKLCDQAGTNQFALGVNLAKAFDPENRDWADDEFHLLELEDIGRTVPSNLPIRSKMTRGIEWVKPYLSQELSEKLAASIDLARPQSEHRQVVAMFIQILPPESNSGTYTTGQYEQLNELIRKIMSLILIQGGSIGQIDPYQSGHKLLAMFGAPRKRESDELRAVACARRIIELDSELARVRIGLDLGPLYCGDVGAVLRREYTVIGEGTNRAARLAAKAEWGTALLGERLHVKLGSAIETEEVVHALKGIGEQIVCYRLLEVLDHGRGEGTIGSFIGRTDELFRLRNLWGESCDGKPQAALVEGEAGIGKTALVQKFISEAKHEQAPIVLSGISSILHERGWLARKLLSDLFETAGQKVYPSLKEQIKNLVDPRWWPLLTDLIEEELADNEWTNGLSATLRREKTNELYIELVNSLSYRPRLVVIDDLGQADPFSLAVLAGLTNSKERGSLMVILIARKGVGAITEESETVTRMELSSLGDADWQAFFNERFDNGKREREYFERLMEVSAGNPHFVMSFIERCHREGILGVNPVTHRLELVNTGFEVIVPEGLKEHHLAQFDALPEKVRELLKVVSVLGISFDLPQLKLVSDRSEQEVLLENLTRAEEAGIIEAGLDDGSYAFRHSSMRDAIYDTIPQQTLKQTHWKVGYVLEPTHADKRPDILADHFYKAGLNARAFSYYLKGLSIAHEKFSLAEMAGLIKKADQIVAQDERRTIAWSELDRFYSIKAEFLILEGDNRAAYRNLRRWRQEAKRQHDNDAVYRICTGWAKRLFGQSRYGRSRKVLEWVLNSEHLPERFAAVSLAILAEVDRRTGAIDSAIDRSYESIEMAQGVNDEQTLSDATNNLGLALWGKGRLAEAAQAYEWCLELKPNRESQYARAKVINNLAIVYWEKGNFKRARKLMQQSLDVFQRVGDRRNQAYCSGNLAVLSRIGGRIWEARRHFELADRIFEKLGDKHAHYYTVGNLGDIDLLLGELMQAEERFQKTREFAVSVGDQELVAECYSRMGELSFFSGDWTEAENQFTEGMTLATEIGSSEYLIRSSIGLARLYIGQRKHEEVETMVARIRSEAGKINAIAAIHEADFITAEKHRIKQETDEAIKRLKEISAYANDQEHFELKLLSLVRLYELDTINSEQYKEQLKGTIAWFESSNGSGSWNQLLGSPFLRYFSNSLNSITPSEAMVFKP